MLSRRTLLALLGTTTTAGCLSRLSASNAGFRLGPLWVTNGSNEPQTLSLVLERNGEPVFDDVLELGTGPNESLVKLEPTWSIEPATYTLSYGLSDTTQETYELTANDDETEGESCMFVRISIHPAGDVPVHSLTPANEHPWDPPCP